MPRKLSIYTGLKADFGGLTGPAILTVLVDRHLSGDDDPITISELCDLTAEPRDKVLEVLEHLTEQGLLTVPTLLGEPQPWNTIGTFQVRGMTLAILPDQGAMAMQPAPGLRKVLSSSRDPLGEEIFEEVSIDALVYRAEVRATSDDFILDVTRKSTADDAMPELVVSDMPFSTLDEAWAWWEEFLGDRETGVGEDDQDEDSDDDKGEGQEAA